MRSYKHLAVRSDRGYVVQPATAFSTDFVRDGNYAKLSDDEIVTAALDILSRRMMRNGPALLNPQATRDYLRLRLTDLQHEVFVILFLDTRHNVIACEEMFRGTLDGASVHPREVVKRSLELNCAAIIACHNHPSGVAEPSAADEAVTQRLKAALGLVDIRLLDHLIVGACSTESFAERGLL